MRSLQQNSKNLGISLSLIKKPSLKDIEKNKKSDKNFLIKVHYSPINPSDLGFLSGVYGKIPYSNFPKNLGFEGSGIILDTSENNKSLIGKKVAFYCDPENEE
jgi:NADPH:quinone reductase-like Zn-dependent oxidoreductase